MEEEELLQAKEEAGRTPAVTPGVAADIASLRGRGQPLPTSERAFFEPRFGRDFGHVRVHTDARAARSARALNADAFTLGSDVAFASRKYAPGTTEGKRLLAHELSHVLQQQDLDTVFRQGVPDEPEEDDWDTEENDWDTEEGDWDTEEGDTKDEELENDDNRESIEELGNGKDLGEEPTAEAGNSDRCSILLDELSPLLEIQSCKELFFALYDEQDLFVRTESMHEARVALRERLDILRQKKAND